MKDVTHRTIIQDRYPTQIRFYLRQILDVRTIPQRTVLSVVSRAKVLPLALQPVDHGIRVLLYGGRKSNQIVPFADLAQELMAIRTLVHIVQYRYPRMTKVHVGCSVGARGRYRTTKAHFDHVASAHAAPLGHGMDQSFVEIDD